MASDLKDHIKDNDQYYDYDHTSQACQKCKEELDRHKFQLDLHAQRERNHQLTLQRMKDIQAEYESHLSKLSKDYKAKEDSLKQKYKLKEEALLKDQRDNEQIHEREIDALKKENNRLLAQMEDNEREFNNAKEQWSHNETNTLIMQRDYKAELDSKDRQLVTIENSVKSLTEEATKQIDLLTQQNNNLIRELNQYRQCDKVALDNVNVNCILPNTSSVPVSMPVASIPSSPCLTMPPLTKSRPKLSDTPVLNSYANVNDLPNHSIQYINQYDIAKIKELRERVKELEDETVQLTRELTLKYEECESLHDEITKLKQSQVNPFQYSSNGNSNGKGSEVNYYNASNDKEEDYTVTNKKIEEMEALINSYGHSILLIKETYDKVVIEHSNEINTLVHDYENKIEQLLNESNRMKQALNREEKIKDSVLNWKSSVNRYTPSMGMGVLSNKGLALTGKDANEKKKSKSNYDMTIGHNEGKAENINEQMTELKQRIEHMN